tara:strand:- start:276 stop:806 length:531 start_codon:yes stop_codon:yes gene_type:complete
LLIIVIALFEAPAGKTDENIENIPGSQAAFARPLRTTGLTGQTQKARARGDCTKKSRAPRGCPALLVGCDWRSRGKSALARSTASAKALFEAVYTATGIHDFLLAGEEGVALGAHINVEVFATGGPGGYNVAAAARCLDGLVFGMYFCFHGVAPVYWRRHPISSGTAPDCGDSVKK